MLHGKVAAIMVPIDDTLTGNLAIRKMFGIDDQDKFPQYPQLVLFHPRNGRFAVYKPLKHNGYPIPTTKGFHPANEYRRPKFDLIESFIN